MHKQQLEESMSLYENIICEHCHKSNLVKRTVLERRQQKLRHLSMEDPVYKRLSHLATDLGSDLNEALKSLYYTIDSYEKGEKPDKKIITNKRQYEVIE
jgi:macrodomain Ter protein organizer (MatP/YcbG family)